MLFRYFVVDLENDAVLCLTDSAACANSLVRGLLNAKMIPVPQYFWLRDPNWRDRRYDVDYLKLTDTDGPILTDLPEHLVNEEYIRKRYVVQLRRNYLIRIERFLEVPIQTNVTYFDQTVFSYLETCLRDQNHPALLEYAEYSGIPVERAIDEIRFLIDTQGRLKVRNMAAYSRYVEKVNKLFSESDLEKCMEEFFADAFLNARF